MKNLIFSFFLASTLSLANSQPEPVACYPFSGNANDVSGNSHHGTVIGAVLAPDRFGSGNSAYLFDGINDNIDIPNFNTVHTTQEISISFWAKVNNFALNSPFLLIPDQLSDRLNIHIHYSHNGVPTTMWDYGSIYNDGRITMAVPYSSQWDHYVFVSSQSLNKMEFYKNGIQQLLENHHSTLVNKNRTLSIGGGMSGITNCFFNGLIDDVQIYDVALSSIEVAQIFLNNAICGLTGISIGDTSTMYLLASDHLNNIYTLIFSEKTYGIVKSVELVDNFGRILQKLVTKDSNIELNLENETQGIFYLRIECGSGYRSDRIIKL